MFRWFPINNCWWQSSPIYGLSFVHSLNCGNLWQKWLETIWISQSGPQKYPKNSFSYNFWYRHLIYLIPSLGSLWVFSWVLSWLWWWPMAKCQNSQIWIYLAIFDFIWLYVTVCILLNWLLVLSWWGFHGKSKMKQTYQWRNYGYVCMNKKL